MKTTQISPKFCEHLLDSVSTTKWLALNAKSIVMSNQQKHNQQKYLSNLPLLTGKNCCKATIRQMNITYIVLEDGHKNLNRKDLLLQYTMMLCQSSFTMVMFAIWQHVHVATICGQFLSLVCQILQYICAPSSTTCTKNYVFPNQKWIFYWLGPPFIEWDPSQSVRPDSFESVSFLSCDVINSWEMHFLL